MKVSGHTQSTITLKSAFVLWHRMFLAAVDALLRSGFPAIYDIDIILRFQFRLDPAQATMLYRLAVTVLKPSFEIFILDVYKAELLVQVGNNLVSLVVLSVNQTLMLLLYLVDCPSSTIGAFLLSVLLSLQSFQVLRFFNLDINLFTR